MINMILTPKALSSNDLRLGHNDLLMLISFLATTRNCICWWTLFESPTLYKTNVYKIHYIYSEQYLSLVYLMYGGTIDISWFTQGLQAWTSTPAQLPAHIILTHWVRPPPRSRLHFIVEGKVWRTQVWAAHLKDSQTKIPPMTIFQLTKR